MSAVPDELVLAIETADIVFRPYGDDEGRDRVMVRCAGLGAFHFDGIKPTADRIERHYELTRKTCLRAARLISSEIGRRNRRRYQGRPRRRYGSTFVNAFRDPLEMI